MTKVKAQTNEKTQGIDGEPSAELDDQVQGAESRLETANVPDAEPVAMDGDDQTCDDDELNAALNIARIAADCVEEKIMIQTPNLGDLSLSFFQLKDLFGAPDQTTKNMAAFIRRYPDAIMEAVAIDAQRAGLGPAWTDYNEADKAGLEMFKTALIVLDAKKAAIAAQRAAR